MAQGSRIVGERWGTGGVDFLQGKVAFNNGKTVSFLKLIWLHSTGSQFQSHRVLRLHCGMWDPLVISC